MLVYRKSKKKKGEESRRDTPLHVGLVLSSDSSVPIEEYGIATCVSSGFAKKRKARNGSGYRIILLIISLSFNEVVVIVCVYANRIRPSRRTPHRCRKP